MPFFQQTAENGQGEAGASPPAAAAGGKRKTSSGRYDPFWLGKKLVELKQISPEQLNSAIEDYKSRPVEAFARSLERLSLASQQTIAQLTADHYELDYVNMPPGGVPTLLTKRLPQVRAKHYVATPYKEDGGAIILAVADPSKYTAEEAERDFPGRTVRFVVAPRADILATIDAAHAPLPPASNPKETLDEILSDAVAKKASDVHFEPKPEDIHIRFRIHGRMVHQSSLGVEMKAGIINAIKNLAKMDVAEKSIPQDGQARHVVGATAFNLRVSVIPTERGERAVIRLLDENRNFGSLPDLGLSHEQIATFLKLIQQPNGIFYITGPTGSGKTTLQYALLATQDLGEENVMTIEDPVEYQIYSYNQCSVNEQKKRTFEIMLRAFLRQDPDVILIGETRDAITAKIAMNAALTGHRVFSTLHTNDAPSVVTRLMELDVDPFVITSAVKAVCAIRLVGRLCSCARPTPPETTGYLYKTYGQGEYKQPVGCSKCNGTGFSGRTAILEVYPLTDEDTQQLILNKAPGSKLAQHLHSKGYPNLREDGIAKARRGIVSIQEILAQT